MEMKIYYIVVYLIEGLIFWQYCSSCFHSRYSKWKEGAFILFLYILCSLPTFFNSTFINGITFFLGNFILLFLLYQAKWHTALFHAALSTIVMGLGELIIIGLFQGLINNYEATQFELQNKILPTILSKLVYFIIMQFLIHLSRKQKEQNSFFDQFCLLLIVMEALFIPVLAALIIAYQNLQSKDYVEWLFTIAAILMMLFHLFIWIIYRYTQRKHAEFAEMQVMLQKESDTVEYYKMMSKQNENRNILIHDIKKHLQSIALLNRQGEPEKIAAYIEQIISSSDLQTSVRVCDNEFLNGILCRYARQCRETGISLGTDIRSDSVDFLSETDLTSLFCNLLDNAMEACRQIPQASIDLAVKNHEGTPFTVITMTNSCRTDPFSPQTGQLQSSKPGPMHHGFGMKIIGRVVKSHGGEMEIYYEKENYTFHTIITLKKG